MIKKSAKKWYEKNKAKVVKAAQKYKEEKLVGINPYFYRTFVIPTVLQRDDHKCVDCDSTRFLEVHHLEYNLDNPTINDLKTLCKSCHKKLHESQKKI